MPALTWSSCDQYDLQPMLRRLKKSLVILLVFSLLTLGLQSLGFANEMVSDANDVFVSAATQTMEVSDASSDNCQGMECCTSQGCQSELHCTSGSALAFPGYDISFDRNDRGVVVHRSDSVSYPNLILSIYRPPWA